MNGMILAAGLGTRFRPHTNLLPKQAFPFLNIPLLYYAAAVAEKFQAAEVVFNTHHLPDRIRTLVERIPEPRFEFRFSHEPKILGNAGALDPVRDRFRDESFFVMNSDTVILPSDERIFDDMLSLHRFEASLATLLVMEHPGAGKQYGAVWIDAEQNVLGFGKTPPVSSRHLRPYHFTGIRIFSPRLFDYLPAGESDIFKEILPRAIEKGETVKAFVADLTFFDGGDLPEFLQNTRTALAHLETSDYLRSMAERFWPSFTKRPSLHVGCDGHIDPALTGQGRLLLGNRVHVDPLANIEGFCVIGDDTVVESHCYLENVVLAPGLRIKKGSVLKNDLVLTAPGG